MAILRFGSGGPFEDKAGCCRAVVAGGWVHVAGTVAGVDGSGEPPAGSVAQCASALSIIGKALKDAGASFSDVVRDTYMLPNIQEFEPCWPLMKEAFGANPPAATGIECGLVDPKYRIEIEVTAYIGQ